MNSLTSNKRIRLVSVIVVLILLIFILVDTFFFVGRIHSNAQDTDCTCSNLFYTDFHQSNVTEVKRKDLKWIVTFFNKVKNHFNETVFNNFCSGVLLNPTWVLASGHCFDNSIRTPEIDEYAGVGLNHELLQIFKTKSQFRKIKKVNLYIEYKQRNQEEIDNDLAIVEVDRPFEYNENVEPACLTLKENEENYSTNFFVSGFSLNKQISLKTEQTKNLTLAETLKQLKSNEEKFLIANMTNCTISRDKETIITLNCDEKTNRPMRLGDTGINLFYQFKNKIYVAGIVSGLVTDRHYTDKNNIESKQISSISFTSIYRYMNWISFKTENTCPKSSQSHLKLNSFILRIGTSYFIISLILLIFLTSLIKGIRLDRISNKTGLIENKQIDAMKNNTEKPDKFKLADIKKSIDNVKKSLESIKKFAEIRSNEDLQKLSDLKSLSEKKSTEDIRKLNENIRKSSDNIKKSSENMKKSIEDTQTLSEVKKISENIEKIEDTLKLIDN